MPQHGLSRRLCANPCEILAKTTLTFQQDGKRWELSPLGSKEFRAISYVGTEVFDLLTMSWPKLQEIFPNEVARIARFMGSFDNWDRWQVDDGPSESIAVAGYNKTTDRLDIQITQKAGLGHLHDEVWSFDEFANRFPQFALVAQARYPHFGRQPSVTVLGILVHPLAFGAAPVIPVKRSLPAAIAAEGTTLVPTDEQAYIAVDDPAYLFADMNIPGESLEREVYCLRGDDEALQAFITDTRAKVAQYGSGSQREEIRIFREVLSLSLEVGQVFKHAFEDTVHQWFLWENQFANTKMILGLFLKAASGCCRHFATVMQLLLQARGMAFLNMSPDEIDALNLRERGYLARFCRGDFTLESPDRTFKITPGRHAWNEVKIRDTWYIVDSIQRIFVRRDVAESGVVLHWDAGAHHYVDLADPHFHQNEDSNAHPPRYVCYKKTKNVVEVPAERAPAGQGRPFVYRGGETVYSVPDEDPQPKQPKGPQGTRSEAAQP